MRYFFTLLVLLLILPPLKAQEVDQLLEMSLEELLNVRVEIASRKSQTQEQAPSIVAVISRQDIEAYGARDISDLLRMIPGFEFGTDGYGVIGLSFRGIWAHEGKALVMINGMQVNELAYGIANIFSRIPASMIEKVEVIRGPGSVLYGGFAEVVVINVVTYKGENLQGIRASANAGLVGGREISRNGNISFGMQSKEKDAEFSTHIGFGATPQSARTYTPFLGDIPSVRLSYENAFRNEYHVIADAKVKNFIARYNLTSFTFSGQQSYQIWPRVNGVYTEKYNSMVQSAILSYKGTISSKLSIQPLLEYVFSNPIVTSVYPDMTQNPGMAFSGPSFRMNRYRGEVIANYDASAKGTIFLGGGYIRDEAVGRGPQGQYGFQRSLNPSDTTTQTFTESRYGFLQYDLQAGAVGITAGVRYENTSFGEALAPRLGITYVKNRFNTKLLYGRSFRIPTPYQAFSRGVSLTEKGLKPETANSLELELGYKISNNIIAKANAFYTQINEPIVYLASPVVSYQNFGSIRSAGVEGELQIRYTNYGGFLNAGYSKPVKGTSEGFMAADQKSFMAMPPLKLNAGFYWQAKQLQIAPSLTYLSQRAGITKAFAMGETSGVLSTTTYRQLVLTNLNVSYELRKNLKLNATGHNILGADYRLIQPYYDAHASIPVNDRQFTLGLLYKY